MKTIKILDSYADLIKQEGYSIKYINEFLYHHFLINPEVLIEQKDNILSLVIVHLKIPYEDIDYTMSKIALANCNNVERIRYNIYGDYAYITMDYQYYLYLISKFGSFKQYLTNEDNLHFPQRITIKIVTNERCAFWIASNSSLGIQKQANHFGTFIAPYWWQAAYGEYEPTGMLGNEGVFIKNCFDGLEAAEHIYDSFDDTIEILNGYSACNYIVSGFTNQWEDLLSKKAQTNFLPNINHSLFKIEKCLKCNEIL